MSIAVIFNKNQLAMKVKISHALIKLVLKMPFNAAKRVILLIFT